MKGKMVKFGAFLAFSLAASAYAADACTVENSYLSGEGHLVSNPQSGSAGTAYDYQLWYGDPGASGSMTFYPNGIFKAEWQDTQDFLARLGFSFNDKNGVDIKTRYFTLDYRYSKNIVSGRVFVGVHGWTKQPFNEYFIVDDWTGTIDESFVGRKFGEFEVDGAKYAVHAILREEGEAFGEYTHYMHIFSIRETPRECGHIDISAHFKKFDELFAGQTDSIPNAKGVLKNVALKFGNLDNVMAAVEAFDNAKGSIDYAYIEFGTKPAETSSSSTGPESSSVAGSSSSVAPESSSVAESSSSVAESSSSTLALSATARVSMSDRNLLVFDVQGRVLGKVFVPAGSTIGSAILARFGVAGIYMVKVDEKLGLLSVSE